MITFFVHCMFVDLKVNCNGIHMSKFQFYLVFFLLIGAGIWLITGGIDWHTGSGRGGGLYLEPLRLASGGMCLVGSVLVYMKKLAG